MSSLNATGLQKAVDAELTSAAGFLGRVEVHGSVLTLTFVGEATSKQAEALAATMRAVHAEAMRGHASVVRIDLRLVPFMNSSSMKAFVTFIAGIQDVATPDRYRVRFIRDTVSSWQRRSLNTLQCFAPDWIDVEEQDKP